MSPQCLDLFVDRYRGCVGEDSGRKQSFGDVSGTLCVEIDRFSSSDAYWLPLVLSPQRKHNPVVQEFWFPLYFAVRAYISTFEAVDDS